MEILSFPMTHHQNRSHAIYSQQVIPELIFDWKMIRLHMKPAWSSWGHSLNDSWLKHNQTSYESSLELLRPFFKLLLIEKWSNFIWIQPGALEVILQLILNWNMLEFHENPAWSSWGHSWSDSRLKHDQISYESSVGLLRPFFDWFLIKRTSN